ncbi:hypothetical protein AHP1_191 [Aeromonas phage Ahp1_CNU-2021]|nr:hypothetical protein AHP1_191 [Aeromonas phage Ahp1_CNU-2021]
MNLDNIYSFCDQFVVALNEAQLYDSNEWGMYHDVAISRHSRAAKLTFAIPYFMPEMYDVLLPLHCFNDERTMEKHLADSIQTMRLFAANHRASQTEYQMALEHRARQRKWWMFWK